MCMGNCKLRKAVTVNTVDPKQVVATLDRKIDALMERVRECETYRIVANPDSDKTLVVTLIKNILLEVFSYGPHVTEATFTAISRIPKDRPDLMKPMILHDLEEVDHGEMALKDFIKLGGDEREARARRITPESFAMGATCRMIAERENPFAYLGFMYLFEVMTPMITELAQPLLEKHGFPTEARHFIDFHAEEDIAHANVLKVLVERVVRQYPEAGPAIEYGFDCFAAVYPLPIWEAALRRTRQQLATANAA